MEHTPVEIKEKAEQLYAYVMRFIKDNRKYSEIKQFLMDDGMDEPTAKEIIAEVLVLQKKKAREQMKTGAIITLTGIGISVLFNIVASFNHSRIYIIVYGPVIVGLIMFFRGYSKSR